MLEDCVRQKVKEGYVSIRCGNFSSHFIMGPIVGILSSINCWALRSVLLVGRLLFFNKCDAVPVHSIFANFNAFYCMLI